MTQPSVSPLELWLPDLRRFDPAHPLLALLRRADPLPAGPRGYLAGLVGHFDVAGDLPAGALTRELIVGDAGTGHWLCADPAWVQPDLNGARLLACGQLQLDLEEALALAEPLRAVFDDAGMTLEVSSPDRWHVRVPDDVSFPAFAAPEQALGEDLYEHLPEGPDGRRWRVLMNEVQVLLHQHPLNAERRERGLPPINSLWLWGGGRLPETVGSRLGGAIGDDLLLRALAQRAGLSMTPRSVAAVEAATRGWLVDLQDLPADEVAGQWWPSIQVLAQKQPLLLSFSSGERWLHRPWHRLRLWRRGGR
ncbi:phosphoglycerate mutase [Dyella solisilvae]|uniref:Phosphoglycerate mutase n=1 Tax=Dyella solisilvae TaxID=1920168 RepID=A0A370KA24_9GAMM|nr:phosphoglycerate mutase [Dyella solisilvae]RDI99498.1 phosphoglycerate mutase [Dyella solisilvae]